MCETRYCGSRCRRKKCGHTTVLVDGVPIPALRNGDTITFTTTRVVTEP